MIRQCWMGWGLVLLLTGCGNPVVVPRDHYYRLALVAPAMRVTALAGTLQVERPVVEGELAGRAILQADAATSREVYRSRHHFWESPLATLLQGEMTRYLGTAGLAEVVVAGDWRVPPAWVVKSRVRRFEQMTSSPARVLVEMDLGLQRMKDRAMLQMATYQEEVDQQEPAMTGAIDAFATACQRIMTRWLQDLRHLP